VLVRKIELQEVLFPHFASAVGAGHRGQLRRTFQADGAMAQRLEGAQVAPRPAAEIQQIKGRSGVDVVEQRTDVLADIVVARALPVVNGALVVMRQSTGGDAAQIVCAQ